MVYSFVYHFSSFDFDSTNTHTWQVQLQAHIIDVCDSVCWCELRQRVNHLVNSVEGVINRAARCGKPGRTPAP